MAEYGIPYMGSKGSICNDLIRIFPKAENFYDLFGGGFSVTHAMLLRRPKDYKHFHFNEIRPGICDLIRKAIAGEFNYDRYKPPFVSKEEFFEKIETDPMIKILWSFGNGGSIYLFSKEIEPYKRSLHNAIIFNEFDSLAEQTLGMKSFKDGYSVKDKRLLLRNRIEFFRTTCVPEFLWPYLKEDALRIVKNNKEVSQLRRLEQLERLERLQQLQQLEQLERLQFYNMSYDVIKIKNNSVIYCDPPYKGTAEYDGGFDTEKFLDWCDRQANPVFVSEYNISDKRFALIKTMSKRSLLFSKSGVLRVERVYANRAAIKTL